MSSPQQEIFKFVSRRVSFDLSHNIVHLLPTLEECKTVAKQRSREEWQNRSLNEEMLSEDIIVEIQKDCSASSRHSSNTDSEEESTISEAATFIESTVLPTKSCLKKPPPVDVPALDYSCKNKNKKKSNHGKNNQKKRKRTNSFRKSQDATMISVH